VFGGKGDGIYSSSFDGKEVDGPYGESLMNSQIVFSPEGDYLYLGRFEGKLDMLGLNERDQNKLDIHELFRFKNPYGRVVSELSGVTGGQMMLVGSDQAEFALIMRDTGNVLCQVDRFPMAIWWLKFLPGAHFVTGNSNEARIWKATDFAYKRNMTEIPQDAMQLLIKPPDGDVFTAMEANDKYLAFGTREKVLVYDVTDLEGVKPLEVMVQQAKSICFAKDSRYLIIGCEYGAVRIYDLEKKKLIWKYFDDESGLTTVIYNECNDSIIVGNDQGKVKVLAKESL